MPLVALLGIGALVAAIWTTTRDDGVRASRLSARAPATDAVDAASSVEAPAPAGGSGKNAAGDPVAGLRRRLAAVCDGSERDVRVVLADYGIAPLRHPDAAAWLVRETEVAARDPDESVNVRLGALHVLARVPRRHVSLDPFIEFFGESDARVRAAAVTGRERHGIDGYVDAVARLGGDPSPPVRLAVAAALGTCQDDASIEALTKLLHDVDRTVARRAGASLGRVWRGEPSDDIVRASRDENANARVGAAVALAEMGSTAACRVLGDLTADSDWDVRREALRGLGRQPRAARDEATYRLLAVAQDTSRVRTDRLEAIQALAALAPADAAPMLLEDAERDDDPVIRLFAARTALAGGDHRALPSLIPLLTVSEGPHCDEEDRLFVRTTARETLEAATGLEAPGDSPAAWKAAVARIVAGDGKALPPFRARYIREFW